jgi:PAS domain S-box-containing protein
MRMDVRREPVRPWDLGGPAADVLDTIEDGFYILDADWRFVYANPRACEMWGLTRDALIGRNYWERLPEMLDTAAGKQLREAARAEHNVEFESFSPVLRSWLHVRICPIRGDLIGVYLRNIDVQKRAGTDLRASEERLRIASQAAQLGYWERDLVTNELRSSDQCKANYGLPPEAELTYPAVFAAIHPEYREQMREASRRSVQEGTPYECEYPITWPDGSTHWISVRGQCMVAEDGTPLRNVGVTLDITERKRTERALQELNEQLERQVEERARQLYASQARLRAFFENSPDRLTLQRATADGRFLYEDINPTCERAYGIRREETIGRTVEDVIGAEAARVPFHFFRECLRTGMPQRYVVQRTMAGQTRTVDVMAVLVPGETDGGDRFIITSARDITEREQLEAQLRQAQKMEAVGQLTGGVAHDFNNLLTAVVSSLELIQTKTAEDRTRRLADVALRAAMRGGQLTHQLLSFSRRQNLRPTVVDVNTLLRETDTLLRRAVGETIEVSFETAPDLWPSEVDSAQFEAAVMNLVVNARDAMPKGGQLVLATGNATIGAAGGGLDLPVGDYVVLTVRDTGDGMPREVLAHAFEPFFTTKEIGKGSGLGLSMVHGFARQSGGTVRIESEPGVGTTVRLYLPRAEATLPGVHKTDNDLGNPARSSGTVLVVEDNEDVLHATVDVLRALNHKVFVASTGPQALEVIRRGEAVDLLLSDVVMPAGMSGIELAHQARQLRPSIRVLLTSGYSAEAFLEPGQEPEFPFLAKPYRPGELGRRVSELLKPVPA